MLIKAGILIIGFVFAGILPYSLKRSLKHIEIDLRKYTLSFLTVKKLYGNKYIKDYRRLLFITAFLLYVFFWLLLEYYNIKKYKNILRIMDICVASLTLLAFVPYDMSPYSLKNISNTLQRLVHNILGLTVFISITILIISFQSIILKKFVILGISGFIIIFFTIITTLYGLIKDGLNGFTELSFINGTSLWIITTTILTVLFKY